MVSPDVHDLLVRPGSPSLLLGAAHHLQYTPAHPAAPALTGRTIPKGLDPEHWGAQLARGAEKLDYALAPKGVKEFERREDITLKAHDLHHIGRKLDRMRLADPARGKKIESHLRDLIEKTYNPSETVESLIGKARKNPDFAVTLHGVRIPSLTGEGTKMVRRVGTDVAAMYGASEIVRQIQPPSEKRSHTTMTASAIAHLTKAAEILEGLPAKAEGVKFAEKLVEAGVIGGAELEKHARIFEETYRRSPEDAEQIFNSMLRGGDAKLASLGEAVVPEGQQGGPRGSRFDQMCLDALNGRAR